MRLVLHHKDASRHDDENFVRNLHCHSCRVLNQGHMVLILTERSPTSVVSNLTLLILYFFIVIFLNLIKCRLLCVIKGLLIASTGNRPDYVIVCAIKFFAVSKVETPFFCLLLIPCLSPSIDAIHEPFSSSPGVLACFLNLKYFAIDHIQQICLSLVCLRLQ